MAWLKITGMIFSHSNSSVKIINNINGLVLAGGKSVRMGHDKGLISYHGKPQRVFLTTFLRNFVSNVYVSCNAEQEISNELNPLVDRYDVGGPFNGILTALDSGLKTAWLVVAVDMPNVDGATIKTLLGERDKTKVATCFIGHSEHHLEPLLAIWEYKALPLIFDFIKSGNKSPGAFLAEHDVKKISAKNSEILLNVNYPGQYGL
jgi:molybdopterin-guanine dinucleotide biosynthesis protein A